MCMTLEALMLFISLLPQERVEQTADRIIVNADVRQAVWQASGDLWCTRAPQIDAALRLNKGQAV